jgi:thiosulfate/3-mercaptopyruvate sulfurtransferase
MEKMLVTPEELQSHLDDPNWVVFDVRHELTDAARGPKVYAEGHVPGAYFLHMDHDLAGNHTGRNGRHPLPTPAELAKKLADRGVSADTQVVIYDDAAGSFAVRLWWMLRWLGHGRVALLDGGYPRWVAEKRPTTTEVPQPRAGSFQPRATLGATVDAPFLERFSTDPSIRLIDARVGERFRGEQETIDPVAGHIPGAVNRFWKSNVEADGRFKPPQVLRAEFESVMKGLAPGQVVHSCGSGVTACHNLFAMELAGLEGSRLYPGSWSEWCADPSRPVATRA